MKTFWKIIGVLAIAAVVLGLVGATVAFAQVEDAAGTAPGIALFGGQNGNGAANGPGLNVMAVSEEEMHATIADALGMSVAEFEAALDAGQTPAGLAAELGIDFTTVLDAMQAVHENALAQAVADGLIAQEQADWILSHRQGAGAGMGAGVGQGAGGNGQMGSQFGNGQMGSQFGNGQMGAGQGAGGNGPGTGSGTCIYQ